MTADNALSDRVFFRRSEYPWPHRTHLRAPAEPCPPIIRASESRRGASPSFSPSTSQICSPGARKLQIRAEDGATLLGGLRRGCSGILLVFVVGGRLRS